MPNYKFSIQADATLSAASLQSIQAQLSAIGSKTKININPAGINNTTTALKSATKQSFLLGQSMVSVAKKVVGWSLITGGVS